jgi:uncharacterized RDD family membrane protein YckC
MSSLERIYNQFPIPKPWRRGVALTIDFLVAWLLSVIGIMPQMSVQIVQILVFLLAWFLLRVVVVVRNQGQSLGHWAMDMKVVDLRGRLPGLIELTQREGIVGVAALLSIIAFSNLGAGLVIFVLLLPLMMDCGVAWADAQFLTLHDRLSQTRIVHTLRGFSLDRKLIKIVAKYRQRVRQ